MLNGAERIKLQLGQATMTTHDSALLFVCLWDISSVPISYVILKPSFCPSDAILIRPSHGPCAIPLHA
jgi:hypothetical protein